MRKRFPQENVEVVLGQINSGRTVVQKARDTFIKFETQPVEQLRKIGAKGPIEERFLKERKAFGEVRKTYKRMVNNNMDLAQREALQNQLVNDFANRNIGVRVN